MKDQAVITSGSGGMVCLSSILNSAGTVQKKPQTAGEWVWLRSNKVYLQKGAEL